jgi:hypothetical protein
MKIRTAFVANSSSSSFLIAKHKGSVIEEALLKALIAKTKKAEPNPIILDNDQDSSICHMIYNSYCDSKGTDLGTDRG